MAYKEGLAPTDVDTQTYIFLDHVLQQTGDHYPDHWGDLGTFGTEPGNRPPGNHPADYEVDPDIVDHPDYRDTIIDDLQAVPSLCLSLPPDDLFSTRVLREDELGNVIETQGIYIIGKGFERAASLELISPDNPEENFQINASLEIQGASSTDRWKTAKLSMRIKFNGDFGPNHLDFPLFGSDATDRIKNIILDATNQQSWTHPKPDQQLRAIYIRDQLTGDFQNTTGGLAPHGRHYHIYLNGLYWGLYWAHEFADDHFAAEYLGGSNEDYDILRHRKDNVISGEGGDYLEMTDLFENDLTNPANYEAIKDYLDLTDFVDYMITNFYAGNTDWSFQNWVASHNRTIPDGLWYFHNWDAERTFISVSDDVTGETGPEKEVPDPSGSPTYMHHRLTVNEEYRTLFGDRANLHCFNNGIFTPENAESTFLARLNQIDRAVIGESARWGDNRNPENPPYNRNETFINEKERLLTTFFPDRRDILMDQLKSRNLFPSTTPPTFNQFGGPIPEGFQLIITQDSPANIIYYTMDEQDPRLPGGTRLPSAQTYTEPLALEQSTTILARVQNTETEEWSALTKATFYFDNLRDSLRISEVMFNPMDPSALEDPDDIYENDDFEFIEITNTNSISINLEGIHFTQGIEFTFGDHELAPGEQIVIVKNQTAFEKRYGTEIDIAGTFDASLSNDGESITLIGQFGEPILNFKYNDQWFTETDGEGFSLVLRELATPGDQLSNPLSWRRSTQANGSPGESDPDPTLLRITEIMYNPRGPDSSEDPNDLFTDDDFEFIEIKNIGASSINLNGYSLEYGNTFVFGDLELSPAEFVVLVSNPEAFRARYSPTISIGGVLAEPELSNSKGQITLNGPVNELVLDFEYDEDWYPVTDGDGPSLVTANENERTQAWRTPDNWAPSNNELGSPGEDDPAPPPPLRITEIMYFPMLSDDEIASDIEDRIYEYIEFTNIGSDAIDLEGYELADADGDGNNVSTTFTFPSIILQPNEPIVVVADETNFIARYGNEINIAGQYIRKLSNNDEFVILLSPTGQTIHHFEYDSDWHSETEGLGYSLTFIDPSRHHGTWYKKKYWRPSSILNGTPGFHETPFTNWTWENFDNDGFFDPQITGPQVDPENDGIKNFLEYALNLNPLESDALFLPSVEITNFATGEFLVLTYCINPDADDVIISIEVSNDLIEWESGPTVSNEIATLDTEDHHIVSVQILDTIDTSEKKFVRLRAEENPE